MPNCFFCSADFLPAIILFTFDYRTLFKGIGDVVLSWMKYFRFCYTVDYPHRIQNWHTLMLGFLCSSILFMDDGWVFIGRGSALLEDVEFPGVPALWACLQCVQLVRSLATAFFSDCPLWLKPCETLDSCPFYFIRRRLYSFPCFCCSPIAPQKCIYTLFSFFLFFKVSFIYIIISGLCLRVSLGINDL